MAVKHNVDEFLGPQGRSFIYACVCGRKLATAQPLPEEGDGVAVDVAGDGPGDCPDCFPERAAAKLDGVALHPELGGLEVSDDEQVLEEDLGEEEVVEEEEDLSG